MFGVLATWCDFGTDFTVIVLWKTNDGSCKYRSCCRRFEGIELELLSETGWQLSFDLYFNITV